MREKRSVTRDDLLLNDPNHALRFTHHVSRFTYHDLRSFRQQLGDVHGSGRRSLSAQPAGDVHQATDIARYNEIGAAYVDVVNLLLQDAAGYVRILDREQPSESAATFGVLQLDQLDSFDRFEQALRLRLHLQLPQ
jgi:hypothetical protein